MPEIQIKTTDDLLDIEAILSRVADLVERREVVIHLSRNYKFHLFKDSRIAALLGTIAQTHKLVVKDWHSEWTSDDINKYFRTSLVRAAAAAFTSQFTNDKEKAPSFTISSVRETIAKDKGILEPHNAEIDGYDLVGKTLTFCAFDPDYSEPLSLAGLLHNKSAFIRNFIQLRRQYLKTDAVSPQATSVDDANEKIVAEYIFELYQNGYVHGRYNLNGECIPGIRFIAIRKYVTQNVTELVNFSGAFDPLKDYFRELHSRTGDLRFYEVSISDQGMGILNRFISSRPEFAIDLNTSVKRLELLNRILTEPLTSKLEFPGAGYGLPRMLEAARLLNGFVTLRTDQFWLYGNSCEQGNSGSLTLKPFVCDRPWAPIKGTHFSALFPLRSS